MKICPYCRSPNHDTYQVCVRCRRLSPQEEQRRRYSTILLPARERENIEFVPAGTSPGEAHSPASLFIQPRAPAAQPAEPKAPAPQSRTVPRPVVQQGQPQAQAPPPGIRQTGPAAQPAFASEPRNLVEWQAQAMQFYNAGVYDRAEAAFRRCLELNPDDVSIWMLRGVALRCLRNVDEALACFDKAIELRPDSIEAWRRKGFTLRILNRTEEAIRCYDRIVELNPRDTAALNDKANVLDDLRRHAEAIKVYELVLAINPKDRYAIENKEASERLLKRKAADDYRSQFFGPKPV